jgi:hypothetical protein
VCLVGEKKKGKERALALACVTLIIG